MRKFWRTCTMFTTLALGSGCDAPALLGRGDDCVSLSECQLGLTCVDGRCSDDLRGLAGETPDFADAALVELDAEVDAQEAGLDDAGVPLDASGPRDAGSTPDASGMRDASTPRDASAPDANVPVDAAPARDTGAPDAAPVDSAAPDAADEDAA